MDISGDNNNILSVLDSFTLDNPDDRGLIEEIRSLSSELTRYDIRE